jgi:hypothetical protein
MVKFKKVYQALVKASSICDWGKGNTFCMSCVLAVVCMVHMFTVISLFMTLHDGNAKFGQCHILFYF